MSRTFLADRATVTCGAAAGIAVALVLSACSGSSSASPSSTSSAARGSAAGQGGNRFGGATPPGTFGTIAAISGSTMQVQNQQSGQVAVTWTAATTFTHEVKVPVAAVHAGDCITATAAANSSGTTGATDTPFAATRVTITAPVNGRCGTSGGFRPGGQRPSGVPSGSFPSGFPTGAKLPSGFPTGALPSGVAGRLRSGAFVTGTVTSVSGDTIVVAARTLGSSSSSSRTVTVNAQTTLTTPRPTTSKALKVGLCATAQGKADSTGAVTATSVRITNPVNGACAFVLGGRNG